MEWFYLDLKVKEKYLISNLNYISAYIRNMILKIRNKEILLIAFNERMCCVNKYTIFPLLGEML